MRTRKVAFKDRLKTLYTFPDLTYHSFDRYLGKMEGSSSADYLRMTEWWDSLDTFGAENIRKLISARKRNGSFKFSRSYRVVGELAIWIREHHVAWPEFHWAVSNLSIRGMRIANRLELEETGQALFPTRTKDLRT